MSVMRSIFFLVKIHIGYAPYFLNRHRQYPCSANWCQIKETCKKCPACIYLEHFQHGHNEGIADSAASRTQNGLSNNHVSVSFEDALIWLLLNRIICIICIPFVVQHTAS